MTNISPINPTRIFTLLAIVIFIWAFSWPVSKIGLQYMTPLWFAASRFLIGTSVMFVGLACLGKLYLPKRHDLPLILSIGFFQMGSFLIFLNCGLLHVDAGRAAILTYTTPIWILPVSILFFGERMTRLKSIGFFLGVVGIALLFSPWNFDWSNKQVVLGNGFLLLAAICWAIAIIHARYAHWHSKPLQLAPWQLLVATIECLIIAYLFDPHPTIHWTNSLWFSLAYNGVFATAFAFWGSVVVSKELPTMTTSLCLLAVPVLGFIFSAAILGEALTVTMLLAMGFIVAGLGFVALSGRNKIPHRFD